METIVISEKKVKIILSGDDLRKYGLSCENIGICESGSRIALREILKNAVSDAGIDIANRDMMIEAYPSLDGSCELFVSMRDRSEKSEISSEILPVCRHRTSIRAVYDSKEIFENALDLLKGNVNITKKEAVRDRYTGSIILDIFLSFDGEGMSELFSALLLSFGAERVSIVGATDFSEERAEKLDIN